MNLTLTNEDFNLIIDGLEHLPNKDLSGNILVDLTLSMIARNEEAKEKMQKEREKQKTEREILKTEIKNKTDILKSKLILLKDELVGKELQKLLE